MTVGVYIIQFDQPLGNPNNQRGKAQYYVGWSSNIEGRMFYHLAGKGAHITRAAVQRGIGFEIVLIIPGGTRTLENQIKRQKNTRKWLNRYLRSQHERLPAVQEPDRMGAPGQTGAGAAASHARQENPQARQRRTLPCQVGASPA